MNICRFLHGDAPPRIGAVSDTQTVLDLSTTGLTSLLEILETPDALGALLADRGLASLPRYPLADVRLLPPVEQQEVWAAGVTYLRSKAARMEESSFSAAAYDQVYAAGRPELFFKSLAEKVVAPGEPVGIRRDARWSVPEPELALVLNSRGEIVGCTIGNDMSSRDIEGENLLYLPQAKVYDRSCALGPWITLGGAEAAIRRWTIGMSIARDGQPVFAGGSSIGQIKRSFADLAGYLFRSQKFPHGAILLTGTGIVPPDAFSLRAGDEVAINISGIGTLRNSVIEV